MGRCLFLNWYREKLIAAAILLHADKEKCHDRLFSACAAPEAHSRSTTRKIVPGHAKGTYALCHVEGGGGNDWLTAVRKFPTFSAAADPALGIRAVMALAAAGIALLLAAGLSGAGGEPCPEPTIVPSYYTTADAVIASESVFVVEIALTCRNGAQNVALYADVNGKQFPVTRGQDVGRYQVSWSMEHRDARSGTYAVKFFDEESYSALRKAQRNNEDVSSIPALFTVSVAHRGAWSGPWVSTEVLAAAIGLLVYYLALSAKSSIQA
ncbi:translocon-associated protein subunit delta [Carettochelys insculpta]|uniref:translocon-associated protein subunit delta n=1 Tax=Carettochelys insculpta TaxID=44489 RepID=UPI003EBF8E3F